MQCICNVRGKHPAQPWGQSSNLISLGLKVKGREKAPEPDKGLSVTGELLMY